MHACYRDSVLGSSVVASMLAAHPIAGTGQDKVDLFVTPSNYAKRKLSVAVPAERVAVNPNFVVDQGAGDGAGGSHSHRRTGAGKGNRHGPERLVCARNGPARAQDSR